MIQFLMCRITTVSVVAALFTVATREFAEAATVQVSVHLTAETAGRIAPDFIGFGYESSAVAQTNYFRGDNAPLIQLYRHLSSDGLIRIGGNVSDHTQYQPDGVSAPRTERETTIINRKNLQDLAAFARATGWRVMWGLNLGTGTKEEAAHEAVAVSEILGDRLESFQIGNEVDLRSHYETRYDDFNSYYSNYVTYTTAIRAVLPNARFSGPDVAGNLEWFRKFAEAQGNHVQFLTHHYYRTGAGRPDATIETLLAPDRGWIRKLDELHDISRNSRVPFRINEVNSFYGGGKRGVSDSFASALWCLDYMFELASHGCAGVNMETDVNQLGWISHYSPIVHDPSGNCGARPEYYGMLAFALAGKGDLLKLALEENDLNLTAYATRQSDNSIWLTVINKDLARDAELTVRLPEQFSRSEAFKLAAPSVESTNDVTLAGAEISADGHWEPDSINKVPLTDGKQNVTVPHASAILLHLIQ